MSDYKIDNGLPIPASRNTDGGKYPLRKMAIGDSFIVPLVTRDKVYPAVSYFSKRNPPYKFTIRKTDDGYRVWRIA